MRNLTSPPAGIQWHEGMLLSPQHFQQESARVDALIAWHTQSSSAFSWGVRSLHIDSALLAAGVFRVNTLEATLPDGTAVSYSSDEPTHGKLELDLAPHADAMSNGVVNIYLVLPVSRVMRSQGVPSRFRSVSTDPVEDAVSDALPADIPRLILNLSLQAGLAPTGLYSGMRLATVYKDNEVIKQGPELPALLALPKQGALWERISDFVGQLRGKAAFVAKQTASPSSRTEDRLVYLEQRERLRNLVSGLPQVEAAMRTPELHPYHLFMSLSSLLGPLSMLRPGALPPLPPEYDHSDPLATLTPVLDALQSSLDEVSQDYREIKFDFKQGAFELLLQPDWLDGRLVVGLRGQPERELNAWISAAIIGSQSAYSSLRERRVLGAERVAIDSAQDLGIRASAGYSLFSITVDPALTVPNEALVISNSAENSLTQRPLEVILFVKG